MKRGKFIVIEGLDACGKSTISQKITAYFDAVMLNALPKSIKPWLHTIGKTEHPEATFSYFTLCNIIKAQEVNSILATGKNVILDRYFYSTYVYHKQMLNGNVPKEMMAIYNELLQPDLVVFLDVPQKIREERIRGRAVEIQWYGDAVSLKNDLTNSYFEMFKELNTNVLIVDNYSNSANATTAIIVDRLKAIGLDSCK